MKISLLRSHSWIMDKDTYYFIELVNIFMVMEKT